MKDSVIWTKIGVGLFVIMLLVDWYAFAMSLPNDMQRFTGMVLCTIGVGALLLLAKIDDHLRAIRNKDKS